MIKYVWSLPSEVRDSIEGLTPKFGFNGFGEATYYRTYSRRQANGKQETWHDTVLRVIRGLFTIRFDWYTKHNLPWDEEKHTALAKQMAVSMFKMQWLPPGRGLWAMGTDFVSKYGSAALNNCGAADTKDLVTAAGWAMDMLMCGVGVGYNLNWDGKVVGPSHEQQKHTITDDRQGWVNSVQALIGAYIYGTPRPKFDYSLIRKEGLPIKGFGGTSSGPGPLKELHKRITRYLDDRLKGKYSAGRTVSDIFNAIGACVVAGNVRRSALINLGDAKDEEFLDLKDYSKNPERQEIGWMSNNTAILKTKEDFKELPNIAKRIQLNGEPGIINLINVQKYGRFGEIKEDAAWLANPCGEIPLESFELCNLVEVFPTKCGNSFNKVLKYATFYASTVSLLPTHKTETNSIIAKNRRIGVSLSGIADWLDKIGATAMTSKLREGYQTVKSHNAKLNAEAGIPAAIRCTTVKPSGTISLLAGVSSGMHFPTFKYAIRRMRVGDNTPVCKVLKEAGVPNETDMFSEGTTIFEFPIDQGSTREATQVSAWEQFSLLAMLQREWSDNMVSCSVYFDKEQEGKQVEYMLAQFAPVIKSVSMLPHSDLGAYPQMPYEGITRSQYRNRKDAFPVIDWGSFIGDGTMEKFCDSGNCTL